MKADRFMEGYSVFCYFSHFTPRRGILELKETLELIESEHLLSPPRNLQHSGQVFAQGVNTPPKRTYLWSLSITFLDSTMQLFLY